MVIVMFGLGRTIKVNVLMLLQLPVLPITVYTVVAVGETTILVTVELPGNQV